MLPVSAGAHKVHLQAKDYDDYASNVEDISCCAIMKKLAWGGLFKSTLAIMCALEGSCHIWPACIPVPCFAILRLVVADTYNTRISALLFQAISCVTLVVVELIGQAFVSITYIACCQGVAYQVLRRLSFWWGIASVLFMISSLLGPRLKITMFVGAIYIPAVITSQKQTGSIASMSEWYRPLWSLIGMSLLPLLIRLANRAKRWTLLSVVGSAEEHFAVAVLRHRWTTSMAMPGMTM